MNRPVSLHQSVCDVPPSCFTGSDDLYNLGRVKTHSTVLDWTLIETKTTKHIVVILSTQWLLLGYVWWFIQSSPLCSMQIIVDMLGPDRLGCPAPNNIIQWSLHEFIGFVLGKNKT